MDRDRFMTFFRDDEHLASLSADDQIEVFLSILAGQSDITIELLEELCHDYDTSLEQVLTS